MKIASILKWTTIAIVALLAVSVGLHLSKTPEADREWAERFQRLNTAETHSDGTVTIHNVRDWTYEGESIVGKDWIDTVTVHPENIIRVWFLLEPFPSWDKAGHTYLTFEFENGLALSFSVEAKMEHDESYDGVKGLFREYELAYTWGTERDFLTRRIDYLDHEVYRYPLILQEGTAATIFTSLIDATNELSKNPRFYNTLTANCTNLLAETVNEKYGDRLPYDLSWNLPGSSDEFLIEQGYIESEGTLTQTRTVHGTYQHKTLLSSFNDMRHTAFSAALREVVDSLNEL